MTTSFDFILLPIARQHGIEHPEIPGLCASMPPRRAGRGRSLDRLVIHLALQGNAPLSPKAQEKLHGTLAEKYFKTTGSATAAMRAVAESLNNSLFNRNQRGMSRGMRSLGLLSQIVFRNERVYLAQSGSPHAFLIRQDGVQHFFDPDSVGVGLGVGKATPIQYRQSEISAGDLLIVSPTPPQNWNPVALRTLYGQPLETVHKRLLPRDGGDVEAVLIQITVGSGKLRTLRPEPVIKGMVSVGEIPAAKATDSGQTEAEPEPDVPDRTSRSPEPETKLRRDPVRREGAANVQAQGKATDSAVVTTASSPPVGLVSEVPAEKPETQVGKSPQPEEEKAPQRPKKKREPLVGPAILAFGRATAGTLQQFFQAAAALFRRMLPDDAILDLPPGAMMFGAIAVPLVIVTAASVVYFREGRGRMHEEYLAQAQTAAEAALPLEDPLAVRNAWQEVDVLLDQAEGYGTTEDSQALRTYTYAVLDNLDQVERLDFQPAIVRGLPDSVIVSKISANNDGTEIYLLDQEGGQILRATFTDNGYELDPTFVCGPKRGEVTIARLIDMEALPPGEEDEAVVLGMDENANLLRCIPGEGKRPTAVQLPPPDTNWDDPSIFAMDGNEIYILDPETNAVWVYWGINDYESLPKYFFGNNVPDLKTVVDMAVSDGDLFLLHEDGQISLCSYSPYPEAPTRCEIPAQYVDMRAGYENGPTLAGAEFSQIQFSPPPDPSLYLLDPEAHAIYHLSMRLAFQRQYRPDSPVLGEQVTAFAVSLNRRAFMAVGDQVYVAVMP